jgi:glycosyltransferase involved in cell wall biosynthesis
VVDDGSTDDSVSRVSDSSAEVAILRQKNSGPAAARNAGLRAAHGDMVAFLDADDVWHPRKIEVQVNHLLQRPECGIVFGNWIDWHPTQDDSWTRPAWPAEDMDSPGIVAAESGWLYTKLLRESLIHTSSVMFRRSVVDQTGEFDETLRKGQDLDYWLRATRHAWTDKLDLTLSLYRIHATSLTFRPADINYRATILENALQKWGARDESGQTLDVRIVRSVISESWKQFSVMHLRHGSVKTSRAAAWKAASLTPFDFSAWRLWMRTVLTGMWR